MTKDVKHQTGRWHPTAIGKAARLIIAALVLSTALGAFTVGDAHAARPEDKGYYRCWVEGYGWMWCKDVGR